MNEDLHGPNTNDDTEGMFPHLHNVEKVTENGDPVRDKHAPGHHVHVTPLWPMVGTFAALIVLTVLTVVTAKGLYFGNEINLVIALIIAGTKAILVAAFFMHLLYDKAMNTVIVVSTMFAVVLFISLTMLDIGTRDMADSLEAGEIVPGGGINIMVNEDGQRVIPPKGSYEPWHSDTPSKSVLTQARERYKAKKGHESGEHDAADAPAEGQTPSGGGEANDAGDTDAASGTTTADAGTAAD